MQVVVTEGEVWMRIQTVLPLIQVRRIVRLDAVVIGGARERGQRPRVRVRAVMTSPLHVAAVADSRKILTMFLERQHVMRILCCTLKSTTQQITNNKGHNIKSHNITTNVATT